MFVKNIFQKNLELRMNASNQNVDILTKKKYSRKNRLPINIYFKGGTPKLTRKKTKILIKRR